jgi:hypothetical protein
LSSYIGLGNNKIKVMTYYNFLKVIMALQKEDRTIQKLYDSGVDLIDFVNTYHEIIND